MISAISDWNLKGPKYSGHELRCQRNSGLRLFGAFFGGLVYGLWPGIWWIWFRHGGYGSSASLKLNNGRGQQPSAGYSTTVSVGRLEPPTPAGKIRSIPLMATRNPARKPVDTVWWKYMKISRHSLPGWKYMSGGKTHRISKKHLFSISKEKSVQNRKIWGVESKISSANLLNIYISPNPQVKENRFHTE